MFKIPKIYQLNIISENRKIREIIPSRWSGGFGGHDHSGVVDRGKL